MSLFSSIHSNHEEPWPRAAGTAGAAAGASAVQPYKLQPEVGLLRPIGSQRGRGFLPGGGVRPRPLVSPCATAVVAASLPSIPCCRYVIRRWFSENRPLSESSRIKLNKQHTKHHLEMKVRTYQRWRPRSPLCRPLQMLSMPPKTRVLRLPEGPPRAGTLISPRKSTAHDLQ